MKRSRIYALKADRLAKTCCQTIGNEGQQIGDETHGRLWHGTVFYCAGEMARVRNADLAYIQRRDFRTILHGCLREWTDDSTLKRCFAAMGLGMLGKGDAHHPVLGDYSEEQIQSLDERLKVTDAYDHNWEVFNASLRMGRTLLFGDDPDLVLPHLHKLEKKYRISGYFDDSKDCGDYNNYGLMTINYALRVSEFLPVTHPLRQEIESMFRSHAMRYLDLLRRVIGADGMGWLFGRSAGVLGQLQCLAFLEQLLSKGWLGDADSAWVRCACRKLQAYMDNVFWDEDRQWYSFRDEWRACYPYRTSLPMAWDLWRYFLQLESYAKIDEKRSLEELETLPATPLCEEVVTDPQRHTSYLFWSDGRIKWQMPIMGGPTYLSGDNLPRPYLPGLFEWCTAGRQPILCPRLTIGEVQAWPAWWPSRPSELIPDGKNWIYRVYYDQLVDGHGHPVDLPLSVEVTYRFGSRFFEREDKLIINKAVSVDELRMEVLQGAAHPHSLAYPPVYRIKCHFESSISALSMTRNRLGKDPSYRNYFSHPSSRWLIQGQALALQAGEYTLRTRLEWKNKRRPSPLK